MTHRVKRLCAAVSIFAALAVAAPAAQAASAYASLSNIHIQLVDLDPNDGIAPAITFADASVQSAWAYVRAYGMSGLWEQTQALTPNTTYGPLSATTGPNYGIVTTQAGDLLGSGTGPGATAQSGATSAEKDTDAGGWARADVLAGAFTLTPNTVLYFSATADVRGQAETRDEVVAYAVLRISDEDNSVIAQTDSEIVIRNGHPWYTIEHDLLTAFNSREVPYHGFLYAQVNAYTVSVTPVPEPQSVALMLAGLGAVGVVATRRRKSREC